MVPGARRSVHQHGELKSSTHLPFFENMQKKNALSNRYLNRAAVQLLSHTLNLVNGMICGAVNVTSDRGVYLCAGVIVFSGGARD